MSQRLLNVRGTSFERAQRLRKPRKGHLAVKFKPRIAFIFPVGDAVSLERGRILLAKPKFFNTPSGARTPAQSALREGRVICGVTDVFTRVDPEEGKWFGVIVLNTDSLPTLLHARRQLPEFRVIGEPSSAPQ